MKALRFVLLVAGILFFSVLGGLAQAAPAAPTALDVASVSAPDVYCLFSADCTASVDDLAASFALPGTAGSGFLQSRLWPAGEAGTAGAGLFPYLYRVDLSDMAATLSPACVTELKLDFGPVVPLDYDGDGGAEHVFVVTGGGLGSIAPTAVNQAGSTLTVSFAPAVCAGASVGSGESSFFFGLASPFRETLITAELIDNLAESTTLDARAPQYVADPALRVVPGNGRGGDTVQLIGSGYTPGGYAGTVRWDGVDDALFDIPAGGAFSVPYPIPAGATAGDHTITVCSLSPCATDEFEQLAETPFVVLPPQTLPGPYAAFLPMVVRSGVGMAPLPFSYVVDAGVAPFQAELPPLDGATPRPLAAVRTPAGDVSSFVANELIVQTDDTAALAALLARVGGEIVLEVDPASAGLSGLPQTTLVRVDLATADAGGLAADVMALKDAAIESVGEYAFSGDDGVRMFALAAAEARGGLTVGVNWVGEHTGVPLDSREAPNGPTLGSIPYTPDAYGWAHFAQGTTQDIGVPEAWTLLHRAGKLGNRVQLAILDGGFYPNADFPATTFISVVPGIGDPRNVNGVDGRAPFHGTDVLQTAVARADDDFGIVGVAAPVADAIAVYTSYDYMVSIAAVVAARAAGADIMNMSYSADVPAIFGWTVWPFEATTAAVRASGALLFASAGNDGANVDGEDCFIVCWEHTWVTPCENAGVICVGGLNWDSKRRHPNSNYGSEHVDIYAPYVVYSGQSPAAPGGGATAGAINGTSFAAPYAASVAALVWAADTGLSAGQVWDVLVATAHSSPDGRVNRYVNAYDAVFEAVGVGVDATVLAPGDGATYELNLPVHLFASVGYVANRDGIPVRMRWIDDRDGRTLYDVTRHPGAGTHVLYAERYVSDLTEGAHPLRLRITAGSVTVEKRLTIHIQNSPPTATIDQPGSGAAFCAGEQITFRGSAFDPNEIGGLPGSAFSWRSNRDGALGTGAVVFTSALSDGSHTVTLRVTDSGGLYAEDSISLLVKAPTHPDCTDLPPSAVITSPADNASFFIEAQDAFGWYHTVTFEGYVGDAEDPISALSVAWESDRQGSLGTPTVNPTTGFTTVTARMYIMPGDVAGSWHTITLRVTDTDGNVITDEIDIWVYTLIN
ncbi:MAG: S8 family serine peptidase [Anaerolineales bacterium]|nr:S8 family serine peptidase [Anaerolineales bacterium]